MDQCPTHNCVRMRGHNGAHSAAPSARTLDWDHAHRAESEKRANDMTLRDLDFSTPWYADLNDEDD